MNVLMITHFVDDFEYEGNNRFNYLAKELSKLGNNVEMVTSNFSHIKKEKRYNYINDVFKITMLEEPCYSNNVSISRIIAHRIFSKNLKKYLKKIETPDIIYCSIPSVDAAYEAAKFAESKNIKFILDIQDLWPEAFKMIYDYKILDRLIFNKINNKANYVYQVADEIIAVSQTYVDRATLVNKNVKEGHSVFLGTKLNQIDKYFTPRTKKKNKVLIAYVGTLGHSYDITVVIEALEKLHKKGIENYEFIIMGDGPLKYKFEDFAKSKKVNYNFTGRLSYPSMMNILKSCDIAVNPITKGAAQSIINKHGDYAAAGLPVINTQECKEYRDLLEKYNSGINCSSNDIDDLSQKIEFLIKDKSARKEMGANSRKMAEELFDREFTYLKIIDIVMGNESEV